MGLRAAGLRQKHAINIDQHAVNTYKRNHGEHSVIAADLTAITGETVRKLCGGDVDIIAASPPCQSFSMAGRRSVGDERNDTFLCVPKIAKALRAKIIMIENVSGLTIKRDADGGLVLEGMLSSLGRAGFKSTAHYVVRCEEFGVPQMRKRMLVVACIIKGLAAEHINILMKLLEQRTALPTPPLRRLLMPRMSVTDTGDWMSDSTAATLQEPWCTKGLRILGLLTLTNQALPCLPVRGSPAEKRC